VTPPLVKAVLDDVRARHPRSLAGVLEAQAVDPARWSEIAEMYLGWAARARGEPALREMVDAFVQFSTDVNLSQARYEASGHYENSSFADCYQELYSSRELMDAYLWGVYLTNFLWAHHAEICLFFADRFLARLPADAALVELAPGHGGWGAWALHRLPGARLQAFDISPSSIAIASTVAQAAGVAGRARYTERNALEPDADLVETAEGCICSFLAEHLEQPQQLFDAVARVLKPGGLAFVTVALTAAQIDHIYEYRRESEPVAMAEAAGLRTLETLSVNPRRLLLRARFVPRSMALLLQKPAPQKPGARATPDRRSP
jgi:SAM-dependent methyltransferase